MTKTAKMFVGGGVTIRDHPHSTYRPMGGGVVEKSQHSTNAGEEKGFV